MPPRRDQSIESPPRDVGDATMQRVRGLADGWALPGDTGRLKVVLPPAQKESVPPIVAVGKRFTVTVAISVSVQPLPSVT